MGRESDVIWQCAVHSKNRSLTHPELSVRGSTIHREPVNPRGSKLRQVGGCKVKKEGSSSTVSLVFFFTCGYIFFFNKNTTPYLEAKLNGEVQVAIAHAHIMDCYVVKWNAGLQICSTLIVAGVTQNDVREGREKKEGTEKGFGNVKVTHLCNCRCLANLAPRVLLDRTAQLENCKST